MERSGGKREEIERDEKDSFGANEVVKVRHFFLFFSGLIGNDKEQVHSQQRKTDAAEKSCSRF